jgi:hypothetical protein
MTAVVVATSTCSFVQLRYAAMGRRTTSGGIGLETPRHRELADCNGSGRPGFEIEATGALVAANRRRPARHAETTLAVRA